MNQSDEPQSGFLRIDDSPCYMGSAMRDIEIIRVSENNVIARGYRYGRQWFIKGLLEEFRDSETMKRRLFKEFELHSRLRHPQISQAVGFEDIEGLGVCIIQEWIDGVTLHESLRKGNLSWHERRRILHELVGVVAYLHNCGVVHRDLKPANVMLRNIGGEVVLIDFGIADSDDYVEVKNPAGTLGFVSPEQRENGGASPSDDVYSLGVIMRELTPRYGALADRCTGHIDSRPKDAGDLLKILNKRLRRPKIIAGILTGLAMSIVGVFAIYSITSLQRSADGSLRDISVLNDKNAKNEELVTTLRDSLAEVRLRLSDAEQELARVAEYESMRQNIYNEGCSKIDRVLKEYDRAVFSKMSPEDSGFFTDRMIELVKALKDTIEAYRPNIDNSSISKEDKEKINMDLYNYEAVKLAEYQEKWLKRINQKN